MSDAAQGKYLVDPYLDWTKGEGIPTHADIGVDLLSVETKPWARFEAKGAFIHVKGRGDFVSCFLLEIPPGGRTAPQRHLFEVVAYVIGGHGGTAIDAADGRRHSFEWGPGSLFALPLNARYRHFNGSGKARALLACTHNLPLVMNLFHNEDFVFNNPYDFRARAGTAGHFDGEGELTPLRPGRHMWETNFVPDLTSIDLKPWDARGAGSSSLAFILADGTMHAHSSEIPVARYKKGHRHGAGLHIFAVSGAGYTLLWYEGDEDFVRVPWRPGIVHAPPHWMFHQHFNTAPEPARYLAVGIGSRRYPFTSMRRKGAEGAADTSVKKGGRQIEYEDQDPRIHQIWLGEIERNGVESRMGGFINEARRTG